MSETFVKKIRKTGTSLGINIPLEIIELMNLKEGDLIRIKIEKVKS